MNWTFDIRDLPRFIRVNAWGEFNNDDFVDMIGELVAKDYFQTGSRILIDNTGLDLDRMSDRELVEARNAIVVQNKALAFSKMAIVISTADLPAGRKLAKITQYSSRAIMQIFDDEKVALSWLLGFAIAGTLPS